MSTTHLRTPQGVTACNTKSTGAIRTTANPEAVECARCRKAAGLGKYDAQAALEGLVVKFTAHTPITGPARPAIEARYTNEGAAAPAGTPNPHPPGSAAATWWQRGHDTTTTTTTP